jgi:chromosome segregation ATPase
MSEPTVESLQAEIAELRAEHERDDIKINRYFDRLTQRRGAVEAELREATGEITELRVQLDSARRRVQELADMTNAYSDDLESERARSAQLVRVIEELGRKLLSADLTEEKR